MPQDVSSINIPAIILVNLMGLIVLFIIAVGSDWRHIPRTDAVKALILMAASIAPCCILEPLAFLLDGTNRAVGYLLNTLYCAVQCVWPVGWVRMVAGYLDVKLSRIHRWVLNGYLIAMAVILIVNLFTPILFTVDAQGVYSRAGGYIYILAAALALLFDGVLLSYRAKHRSDRIKFFPVWAFLVPALIGRAIQTFWYGVSTAVPFLAVSLGCCALCMQNGRFYRDSHTHLFNRAYLNTLESRLSKLASHAYTSIFVDVNSFKTINDTYGHVAGDEALIRLAEVLRELVADKGEVIRYAGDEFFILYSSPTRQEVEDLIKSIDDALAALPVDPEKPYRLSVSTGFCPLDFRTESMDEVLDRVDKLMYEKKREYYRNNAHNDRRSRNK